MALEQGLSLLSSMMQQAATDKRQRKSQAFSYMMRLDEREYQEQRKESERALSNYDTDVKNLVEPNRMVGSFGEHADNLVNEKSKRDKEGNIIEKYKLTKGDFDVWKEDYKKDIQSATQVLQKQYGVTGKRGAIAVANVHQNAFDRGADNIFGVYESKIELQDLREQVSGLQVSGEDVSEGARSLYDSLVKTIEGNFAYSSQALQQASTRAITYAKQAVGRFDWLENFKPTTFGRNSQTGILLRQIKTHADSGNYAQAQEFINRWGAAYGSDLSATTGGEGELYHSGVAEFNIAANSINSGMAAMGVESDGKFAGRIDTLPADFANNKNVATKAGRDSVLAGIKSKSDDIDTLLKLGVDKIGDFGWFTSGSGDDVIQLINQKQYERARTLLKKNFDKVASDLEGTKAEVYAGTRAVLKALEGAVVLDILHRRIDPQHRGIGIDEAFITKETEFDTKMKDESVIGINEEGKPFPKIKEILSESLTTVPSEREEKAKEEKKTSGYETRKK